MLGYAGGRFYPRFKKIATVMVRGHVLVSSLNTASKMVHFAASQLYPNFPLQGWFYLYAAGGLIMVAMLQVRSLFKLPQSSASYLFGLLGAFHTLGEGPHFFVISARLMRNNDKAAALSAAIFGALLCNYGSTRLSQMTGLPALAFGHTIMETTARGLCRLLFFL